MLRHSKSIFSIATVLASCWMSANDGSTNATGIAGPFVPNDQVQMVTQDLKIKIYDRYSDFEVTYLFRNHGRKTTVGMAFPVVGYNFDPPVVLKFESWVDEKKAPVEYHYIHGDSDDDDFEARYTKTVTFQAHQERRIVVKYRAENGGDSMGFMDVSYLLEPGSTWKGVLERCDVSVDWSQVSGGISPTITFSPIDGVAHRPLFREERSHRAHYSFVNWELRGDISIEFPSGFSRIRVNGERAPVTSFYTRTNPILEGDELLVRLVSTLLSDLPDYMKVRYADAPIRLVGGSVEITPDGRMITGDGREFLLPRIERRMPPMPFPTEEVDYVYLRDIVEALGGTYAFDTELLEVSITIPERPPPTQEASPPLARTSSNKEAAPFELIALGAGFVIALLAGAGVPRR